MIEIQPAAIRQVRVEQLGIGETYAFHLRDINGAKILLGKGELRFIESNGDEDLMTEVEVYVEAAISVDPSPLEEDPLAGVYAESLENGRERAKARVVKRQLSKAEREALKDPLLCDRRAGMTLLDISLKHGVSRQTVTALIADEFPPMDAEKRHQRDEKIRELIDDDLTNTEIAKIMDVSRSTVRLVRSRYNGGE